MHRGFALLFFPMILSGAQLVIDHATVCGSSIQKLQANLSAAGVQRVYGGAHVNGATEMALVSFPDGSYLEMMAIQPHANEQAVSEHVWAKFLRSDAGPCAWAIREKDIASEVQRLKAAGIPVSNPVKSGRQRPDGVRLEWQTSDIGAELRGTFFPFLIQDLTPREQRAYPQGKPVSTDFNGISRVVIAVKDLESAVRRYRQAYAFPEPQRQHDRDFGANLAAFAGTPVVLAQPLAPGSWLAERIAKYGEGPCAIVLAGRNARQYRAASHSQWFGTGISWLDARKLGWHLGFE